VARFQAARRGVPYVIFVHGVECWRPLPLRARWGLARAKVVFANSEHTRRTFLQYNAWAAGLPTEVIPLGVAAGMGEDWAPRDPSVEAGDITVLTVGRISGEAYYERYRAPDDIYKGFKSLVLAVGLAARTAPRLRLKIVGDGDQRPALAQWLANRDERNRVEMLGRVPNSALRALYAQSQLFASASEGEGFGIAFAEAMAYGLPCVCVRAGAAPEVVQDGRTGLVATPRSVEDLAEKLATLAHDARLRQQLGQAGRRQFEEVYRYDVFQSRVAAALRRAAAAS
jgi:glycosyltransferase involved in cell wall biosynthesis